MFDSFWKGSPTDKVDMNTFDKKQMIGFEKRFNMRQTNFKLKKFRLCTARKSCFGCEARLPKPAKYFPGMTDALALRSSGAPQSILNGGASIWTVGRKLRIATNIFVSSRRRCA